MQVNCKFSRSAINFIYRVAMPLNIASPDLIKGNNEKGSRKVIIVHLPEYLNEYLETLSTNFECNKVETLTAVIEVIAESGLNINEVLEVTYMANKLSKPTARKLTQSAICCALLDYLMKQKLKFDEMELFKQVANEIRGQKQKYIKK